VRRRPFVLPLLITSFFVSWHKPTYFETLTLLGVGARLYVMIQAVDFFTLMHFTIGIIFGTFWFSRWLSYSPAIGWEVFRYYTYYKPQGFYLGNVWLDSLIDVLAFTIGYEIARKYLKVAPHLGFPILFNLCYGRIKHFIRRQTSLKPY